MLIHLLLYYYYHSSIAQSDGPRLVLHFELYPPDHPQRRAARHLVIPSVQQYRDAHRLGQSRDQHRERREGDDAE